MERKLIANPLVPDDEVWVSPATWERPFSLKAKESTVTDTQHRQRAIADLIEAACLPLGGGFIHPKEQWAREWCRQLRASA